MAPDRSGRRIERPDAAIDLGPGGLHGAASRSTPPPRPPRRPKAPGTVPSPESVQGGGNGGRGFVPAPPPAGRRRRAATGSSRSAAKTAHAPSPRRLEREARRRSTCRSAGSMELAGRPRARARRRARDRPRGSARTRVAQEGARIGHGERACDVRATSACAARELSMRTASRSPLAKAKVRSRGSLPRRSPRRARAGAGTRRR